jgi:hypothetical protein
MADMKMFVIFLTAQFQVLGELDGFLMTDLGLCLNRKQISNQQQNRSNVSN